MHTSTVPQKGQIVIPAPLRRKLGFDRGTKVVIVETDDGVEVRPLDDHYFERLAGVLSGEENATQELLKEHGWDTVAQLLAAAAADRCALQGCVVNWGEVLYITERAHGTEKADEVESILEKLPIEWGDADRELTRKAARFRVGGLAYADCFAAGLARQTDREVATDDPEFETVTDQVTVRWLTRD